MKKKVIRIISVILSLTLILGCSSAVSYASAETGAITAESIGDSIAKTFYNTLNKIVEGLVGAICKIYPNPADWQSIADYDSDEVGFLAGHDTYRSPPA